MLEEKTCETCKYFHAHYILWLGVNYHRVASGHCGNPRIRLRFSYAKACSRYETSEPIPNSYLR